MKLNKRNYETVEETVEPVINEEKVEEPEVPQEPEFVKMDGKVINCTSLYVRMHPHSNGTPITTIDAGTTVEIIEEENDFWNVKLSDGTEGFCMKKFIKII